MREVDILLSNLTLKDAGRFRKTLPAISGVYEQKWRQGVQPL